MLMHRITQWPCTGGTLEGRDWERDEDDDNSPAVTVGLAALAIVLLAVVLGVLTLLIRG